MNVIHNIEAQLKNMNLLNKITTANTRFALLRILCKPDDYIPQEILSLTENN